jgi:hypothetical protein
MSRDLPGPKINTPPFPRSQTFSPIKRKDFKNPCIVVRRLLKNKFPFRLI